MIRPATLVCTVLAAFSGLFLYTKKHNTLVLDQQITQTVQATRHIQGQTAMLRTEWALLNQPDRLSVLSQRVLPQLHSVEPSQFVKIDKLVAYLPDVSTRNAVLSLPHTPEKTHLAAVTVSEEPSPHKAEKRRAVARTAQADHHSAPPHARPAHHDTSLERELAMLNADDQPTPSRRSRRESDSAKRQNRESHSRTASSSRASSSSPQAETVVWHPQAARHSAAQHHENSHISSSEGALPPPVPLSN